MRGAETVRTTRARELRRGQTEAEAKLWQRLKGRQLAGHKFVRQEPIGPYYADFACRERHLIVEADGSQHAESQHDQVRDACLRSRGYTVLRFWNHDILTNTDSVIDTIYASLHPEPPPHPNPLPARGERG
ncbi:MAG TPA: DUF559 domain-containing protein [Beijerinckiaceae bacterium]|jgi:very-short-patch-repair endonuclease